MTRRGSIAVARFLAAPVSLLAAIVFFAILSPNFLAVDNISNIITQSCILALFAVGQMFAIVTRGFDISVGATAALASSVAALSTNLLGLPGLIAAPLVGLAVGTVNGLLVGNFRLQPIVVTLGTLIGARSVALLVTEDGQTVVLDQAEEVNGWAFDAVLGLPPIYWAALAALACGAWILHRSLIGRRLLMLGSNPEAAALVGVKTAEVERAAYQLCGFYAGLAGLVMTCRAGVGLPTEGSGMELQSIAAAVIGGTALTGGIANAFIVMLAAVFIQTLLTGLNLMGISPYAAEIAIGFVIIAAGLLEFAIRQIVLHHWNWRIT
jgi:ribose/xylose/arabinose/galactoside ABC-type transport system permease subunit